MINPYTGCVLGCAYCFASFAGRQFGRSAKEWGDYLYVKTNAVDLARRELARMAEHKRHGTMLLSSVTDPYQGHETRYRLTRDILRELKAVEYPGLVRILTKSPVVTRDIDLLTSLPRAEVGMTVTTADDKVSRWLEVRAPLASRCLRTLTELVPRQATFAPSRRPARPLAAPAENPSHPVRGLSAGTPRARTGRRSLTGKRCLTRH
ncbi:MULTISPECIES: SPL family radical SAM protein [Streptomyces]|nr:radical SAM protein [Streptomyces sp. AMCC400023]